MYSTILFETFRFGTIDFMDADDQNAAGRFICNETLQNITARESDFSAWRLVNCSVKSLKLWDGRFNYCRAHNCCLSDMAFDHCLCEHGFYSKCTFDGLWATGSFFTSGYFSECRLNRTLSELNSFGLCVFENTIFKKSRMSEVSFIGTTWRGCRFEGEDYDFVRFPSSVFVDTEFADCLLRKAIFRKAVFINCRFTACRLPEAVFHNARFINTVFEQTDIHEAANLDGVEGLPL